MLKILLCALPSVLLVLNAAFTFLFLYNFVMKLVSLPLYVNFAHLCFWSSLLYLFFLLFSLPKEDASYLLFVMTWHIVFLSFCLF